MEIAKNYEIREGSQRHTHMTASCRSRHASSAKMGLPGSGLAGIMSDAGLTNGAFYAHFHSKSEMVEKSLEQAIDEQWQQFEKEIASGHLLNIVRAYLSKEHRDHPGVRMPFSRAIFRRFHARSRLRGRSIPRV